MISFRTGALPCAIASLVATTSGEVQPGSTRIASLDDLK